MPKAILVFLIGSMLSTCTRSEHRGASLCEAEQLVLCPQSQLPLLSLDFSLSNDSNLRILKEAMAIPCHRNAYFNLETKAGEKIMLHIHHECPEIIRFGWYSPIATIKILKQDSLIVFLDGIPRSIKQAVDLIPLISEGIFKLDYTHYPETIEVCWEEGVKSSKVEEVISSLRLAILKFYETYCLQQFNKNLCALDSGQIRDILYPKEKLLIRLANWSKNRDLVSPPLLPPLSESNTKD